MYKSPGLVLLLVSLFIAMTSLPLVAQTLVGTVPVGYIPSVVAVDGATNKIYVLNPCGSPGCGSVQGTVTSIDGATLATTSVAVGNLPRALAINVATNRIYVGNVGGNPYANTVTIIDGTTLATSTETVGYAPVAVAINAETDKIYVVNQCGNNMGPNCAGGGTVTVIDGSTLATQTINVGIGPMGAAVNAASNKIYVTNTCGDGSCLTGTVTVIDGATLSTQSVSVGQFPTFLKVDQVTNKVYVVNQCGNDQSCQSNGTVSVIDGTTLSASSVSVGPTPQGLAVNAATNKIYVANSGYSNDNQTVTVIDGATLATSTVNVGERPDAVDVNPLTNSIYVANGNDGTVTVINGATLGTSTVAVGHSPDALAVDAGANLVYVANSCGVDGSCQSTGTVSIIAGVGLGIAILAPSSLNFGNEQVGQHSASLQSTLYNNTANTLTFNSITVTGDFSETNNCGSSLPVGGHCIFTVAFSPTATGTRIGSVTVVDNAPGHIQTLNLLGTGTAGGGSGVTASPTSLAFGSEEIGTISAPQSVTFTNNGSSSVTITGTPITGQFNSPPGSSTCGTTLGAHQSCSLSVTFNPAAPSGLKYGTLTFNNTTGSVAVSLSGYATDMGLPTLTATVVSVFQSGSNVTVNLQVKNNGTGNADSIELPSVSASVLAGSGSVRYTGPLPVNLHGLGPGASTNPQLTFTVSGTVQRFLMTERATWQDDTRRGYGASFSQAVIP